MNALSRILVPAVLALGAAVAQAAPANFETDYPANVMSAAAPSERAVQGAELFLVQSNEGPVEVRETIVDSSVDADLIRAGASGERPFDIGYFA